MNQTKIGSRIVVITGTATASGNAEYRKPIEQRSSARRIVVIRDGKSVGRRRDQ